MTWVLAVVVVLLLGAAAVVSSGRWGEMPELVDERVPRVPQHRPVTAQDLREVEFSVVPRGYSMAQVDALLGQLVEQLEDGSRAGDGPGAGSGSDPAR